MIPESFRIVYGFISDNYTLYGSKRRSHIILGSCVQIIMQLILFMVGTLSDFTGQRKYIVPGCYMVSQICISYNGCVIDALAIQVSNNHKPTATFLNSIKFIMWGVGIVSAGLSALAID